MAKDPAFLFVEPCWYTPNTYSRNYREVPNSPGVYLLVFRYKDIRRGNFFYKIMYVGSSKNLNQRYSRHEVLRVLNTVYNGNIAFYFKPTPNYIEVEKNLIRLTEARFNTQWR